MGFSKDVLKLDCAKETDRIAAKMREALVKMKKRGLVVAMSGGIDSSVVGALHVTRSLGLRSLALRRSVASGAPSAQSA